MLNDLMFIFHTPRKNCTKHYINFVQRSDSVNIENFIMEPRQEYLLSFNDHKKLLKYLCNALKTLSKVWKTTHAKVNWLSHQKIFTSDRILTTEHWSWVNNVNIKTQPRLKTASLRKYYGVEERMKALVK